MKIINEYPPIFQTIIDRGMRPSPTAVYSYNGAIYNPSGNSVPEYIEVHESMHRDQQLRLLPPQERTEDKMADASEMWWDRYLDDAYFRVREEAEAYACQYDFMCTTIKDRNRRARLLMDLGRILASPMYGSVVSTSGAMNLIREYIKTPR